jgi:hypothetical protein
MKCRQIASMLGSSARDAVCEVCEKDFFVYVTVLADELIGVEVDQTRPGMIL